MTHLLALLTIILATSSILASTYNYEDFESLINDINPQAILDNHDKDFGTQDKKNFNNQVLVFTTPWHKQGDVWALKNAKKIDYLAPVWFDFRIQTISKTDVDFFIEGDHNVDREYIASLRKKNPNIKIYPRVYIEATLYENLVHLSNSQELVVIADKFVNSFKKFEKDIDGIVFDTPLFVHAQTMQFDLIKLVQLVSQKFGEIDKNIIVSLLANQQGRQLNAGIIDKLFLFSEKLLICTYDYNTPKPDSYPLAPYFWVQDYIEDIFSRTSLSVETIQRKLMMGIPFYGQKLDFQSQKMDASINTQYLEMLRSGHAVIEWDRDTKECVTKIVDPSRKAPVLISYPCLRFISSRLQLFERYGVGAFVWEGGQGLEYFYELF